MALIGNHYRQGASPATNQLGGTNVGSMDRQHAYLPGRVRGFYVGQGAGPNMANQSLPSGYRHPGAWHLSPKAGGLTARITASGGVSAADGHLGAPTTADLTGSGTISNAELGLILSALAALTGSGTLAGGAIGVAALTADLTGSGGISDAGISAVGQLVAALTGSGGLSDAEIYAIGLVTADLVVTGTGLSTANVGQAVWDYILSCGYSAEDAMQILTSVAAGKTTIVDLGGGNATVTFRDLLDTKDVVDADMTGSERTDVNLDP